ncbi:ribosomal protein S5 domain 2-type protein [Haematococcus lacustris]
MKGCWALSCPVLPACSHATGSFPTVAIPSPRSNAPNIQGATGPGSSRRSVELDVGSDKKITLETGEIGRQASGAVMAIMGDTVLYTTACSGAAPTGDGSFVPLTVNYQERFSAVGRTSSGFVKRDSRPRETDVQVSRLVDRPLRPMFTPGWATETQVLQWLLSYDGVHSPEPLAITAASAALLISDIPFQKAVAGVRVGWVDGQPLVSPSEEDMKRSYLDLVLAGSRDAVLMIEGFCSFLSEEDMMQAVEAGSQVVSRMCGQMEEWAREVGQPKTRHTLVLLPEGLQEAVDNLVGPSLLELYSQAEDKGSRGAGEEALRKRVVQHLLPEEGQGSLAQSGPTLSQLNLAFKNAASQALRKMVLKQGRRVDGRGLCDIRPISARAGLLPRTHGSALFTRGETQVIAVATLGSRSDSLRAQAVRSLAAPGSAEPGSKPGPGSGEEEGSSFYLQYFFPPSSVGEVGKVGPPGRRELGHGELAQRALAPCVPNQADFPYVVRLESTVTESNGSSSMASVCGGYLAMRDAGVPLVRPVAGIAMGLVLDPATGEYAVLSDILGSEDALGDMDFKVAGDKGTGITAFQMDIKVEGITPDIMRKALAQARDGRMHILAQMAKCKPAPRGKLSPYAPRVIRRYVDPAKRMAVVGQGGRTLRQIMDLTGALDISLTENGMLEITAPGEAAASRAWDCVSLVLDPPAPNRIFRNVPITAVQAFGVFVELSPGRDGMVHLTELDVTPVINVATSFKVGDEIDVVVLSSTANGKVACSRRAVLLQGPKMKATTAAAAAAAAAASAASASTAGNTAANLDAK